MGTWGPGAFDNDDALDLLDALSGQDTAARRQVLERIFREAREHPENLSFTLGAAEVVAAAAVVAAGLPAGRAIAQEITRRDYDLTALVIPGSDPELAGAALTALLIAAGHDGAWHRDWTDPRTAAQARQTTDQLTSVFYRDQHRHDQELPLGALTARGCWWFTGPGDRRTMSAASCISAATWPNLGEFWW